MIIWGSKAKQKEVGSGTFYCPQCRRESPYQHLRVSRYFTLYFIPLFPTQTLGEAICCRSCAGEFKPAVLSLTQELIESALQPWRCHKCGNHNPYSEAKCLGCQEVKRDVPPPLPRQRQIPDEDDDERFRPRA